jgi:hypothetical protein
MSRTSVQDSDTARLLAYARLVNDMRKAQRCYFAARRKGHHADELKDASIRLEKAVDALTVDVLELTTPSLFDLPPEDAA